MPLPFTDPSGLQLEGSSAMGSPGYSGISSGAGGSGVAYSLESLDILAHNELLSQQNRFIGLLISHPGLVMAANGDDSISATVREAIRRSVEDPKGAYRELQDLLEDGQEGTYDKNTARTISDGQKQIQRNYKLSDYIGQFRQGSVTRLFPRYNDLANMTVKQVLKQSWSKAQASTVNKLLFDGRFAR